MGLVVEGNYVWELVIVAIFMRFGKAKVKRCGECFKVINWGGNASHKRGQDSFYREGGFSLCNTAVL